MYPMYLQRLDVPKTLPDSWQSFFTNNLPTNYKYALCLMGCIKTTLKGGGNGMASFAKLGRWATLAASEILKIE